MKNKQKKFEETQTAQLASIQKKNTMTYIMSVCVVYLCAWSILPQLQLGMIWRLLALMCIAIWVGVVISDREAKASLLYHGADLATLFIILVVVVSYIGTLRISRIITQISFFMLYVGFLMVIFYFYHIQYISILPVMALSLFIIPNIITFKTLLVMPHIMRMLVRDNPIVYSYIRRGVGGYGLLYPQVCLFPAALVWTIQAWKNQRIKFIIGCIWIISYMALISKAGYTIAILSTVISIYVLFFYKGSSIVGMILTIVLVMILLTALIVYSENIRNFLLEVFEGTKITQKINDIMLSVQNGEADGSIGDRVTNYMASISTILNYPIIGGLWMSGGGAHSAIMDAFAKYGIFGGWMFIKMLFSVDLMYKKSPKDRIMQQTLKASMATLLIVGMLNSFPYQCMLPLTIVLLSLIGEIEDWRRNINVDSVDS